MWILYQAAMALALLLAAPVLLLRRGGHYGATLRGRLGLVGAAEGSPAPDEGRLWIHAVSVGEVAVAATAVRALPDDIPLVVTTVTPTGQARARAAFAERDAAVVTYLPFDLGFALHRFLRRHRPRALVLVEGDYWPLVLRTARRRALPVAVINGRLGDTSARRWRTLRRVAPALFRATGIPGVARFGVQTTADRERLLDLGVEEARVDVTGNLKFETPTPTAQPALEDAVRRLAGERPILVAGSTMQGEDEPVLDALVQLNEGRARPAMLVLVPRHPERWDAAVELARTRGLTCRRRSTLAVDAGTRDRPASATDVLLLDTMGELAALYRIADAAFIGGTLVPTGGHNPLEPARFAVPTVVGPSMHNFRQMAGLFDQASAWARVDDAAGLAACWASWLDDPEAARAVGRQAEALLDANRGALDRTRTVLAPLLAPWSATTETSGTSEP